jgi:Tol biopolymer transport system component
VQKLTAPLSGLEFSVSPEGKTILFGDQILTMHSQADGSVSPSIVESSLPERMADLRWSPDGQKFGYVDEENVIWAADLQGDQVKLAEGASPPAWSHDGQWMAYCDQDGRLWIARDGKPADWIVQQGGCSVHWSPVQPLLGYITFPSQDTENFADGTAFLYDPLNGQTKEIARSVSGMDWSPDGKLVSIARITSVGASNYAYTVTVINPETGAEQPMDEYHAEMYENTTWIDQAAGYLFGRYRFRSDLLAKEPVADHLLDATRDGSGLLVAGENGESLEIACQEAAARTSLLNVTLADTPGAAMPGLRGLFSPDGQWILLSDYVEDRAVNWLARCESGSLVQLPYNTWLFDQYFSPDSAWLVMENIRTSNDSIASISLQELASGQMRDVQAGLNTRSTWFQMPEAPPAPTAAPTEAMAPVLSPAPTSTGAPLNLEGNLPIVSDAVGLLSICLWAGALIAILILMVYLWRWSLKYSRQSTPPMPEPPVETPAPAPVPPASEEIDIAFRKGRELVHAGQAAEGIHELQKVVAAAPDNEEAWFWLAIASVRQRDYSTAERCFLQAKKRGHPEADKALEWLKKQG